MFCGNPLVYYTLEIYKRYKECHREHEICLALNTDSDLLRDQVEMFGIEYVSADRKEELAGDTVAKVDVIRDTLEQVEAIHKEKFELIVDLDITSPIRTVQDIEGTIDLVVNNLECNFAYSVVKSRRSPYFNIVNQKESGFYDRVIPTEFTARQQVPECYDMNASIYVYAKEYLMNSCGEMKRALVWEMQDVGVLDIDTEQDFEFMGVILKYMWSKGKYEDIRIR